MIQSFWEIEKLRGAPFCIAGAGRSFVKNLMSMLYTKASHLSSAGVTDVNGTSRTLSYNSVAAVNDFRMSMANGGTQDYVALAASDSSEDVGIVVGTGASAVAAGNSALVAKINHGDGSGELLHWGGLITDPEVSWSYAWFDLARIFENQSGDSIVLKELGITAYFYGMLGTPFLICRDVLAEPAWITVADTEMLKVTYRIRVTV